MNQERKHLAYDHLKLQESMMLLNDPKGSLLKINPIHILDYLLTGIAESWEQYHVDDDKLQVISPIRISLMLNQLLISHLKLQIYLPSLRIIYQLSDEAEDDEQLNDELLSHH